MGWWGCSVHGPYFQNRDLWITDNPTGVYVNVEVEQGTLRGQEKSSIFFPDKMYYSFEGIPYAKPPIGPLRFKDPEECEPWSGIRDAIGKVPEKPPGQFFFDDQFYKYPEPTDDCLYLDVNTPQVNERGKPVIVWICPLQFNLEAGFGPRVFGVGHYMAEDVVFVSVRYRYSILGFLCLDHEEVPGNAGLKDQVMALKWVQKNISKFSGDPNNVTLYGFSIAGAFVHYHLLSPLSAGLFHRIILQGDCALNPYSYTTRELAIKRAFRILHMLGPEIDSTDDLLEFLRTVPVAKLLSAAEHAYSRDENTTLAVQFGGPFVPCVEEPATDKSFLLHEPRELLDKGEFTKVPTIMGRANHGGYCYTKCCYGQPVSVNSNWHPYTYEPLPTLAKVVGYTVNGEESPEWADEVKQFYFNIADLRMNMGNVCSQMFGDYGYNVGFYDSVRLQLEHSDKPLYVYDFPSSGLWNPIEDMCIRCKPPERSEVYNWLNKMWTSFAKTGDPNNETLGLVWEPVTKDSLHYLKLGRLLRLCNGWIAEDRMKMWQQLCDRYPDIRKQYSQVYMRRLITEEEKIYMEPNLELLFGNDD